MGATILLGILSTLSALAVFVLTVFADVASDAPPQDQDGLGPIFWVLAAVAVLSWANLIFGFWRV